MTTVSTITEYTGDVPSRDMDRKPFNDAVYDQLGWLKTFGGEFNTSVGQINTVAGEVNANALNAAASAAASASSANASPYNPATTYDTGDRAIGSDGNTYGCLNDSVTGDNPVGSATGNWVAITVLTSVISFVQGGLRAPCFMVRGGAPSDGGGLNVSYTAFAVDISGVDYTGAASSIALTAASANNEIRFVYVNSSGVMTSSSTVPTGNYVPVAIVYVTVSDIVSLADVRKYAPVNHGKLETIRPLFTGSAIDYIYLKGLGAYSVAGVGRIWFYGTLTYQLTSLAASTWTYLYIDTSSLAGQGPITNANLIDNTTAPTYDPAKGGWYNGDDLCIMAVRGIDGSSYSRFDHDGGDCIIYDSEFSDLASTALTTGWVDLTLTIPIFSTKAMISFFMEYVSASAYASWRKNGSGSTNGTLIGRCSSAAVDTSNQSLVVTDAAQKIEYKGTSTGCNIFARTNAWYFGQGM